MPGHCIDLELLPYRYYGTAVIDSVIELADHYLQKIRQDHSLIAREASLCCFEDFMEKLRSSPGNKGVHSA